MRRVAFVCFGLLLALSLATGHVSVAALADPAGVLPQQSTLGGDAGDADNLDDTASTDEPDSPAEPETADDPNLTGDPDSIDAAAPVDNPDPEAAAPLRRTPRIPAEVRGIYLTAHAAADKAWTGNLIRLIEETELNAIVIDVKNDSGLISIPMPDGSGDSIPDLPELLGKLQRRGIYTIARLVVFKDPVAARNWPERAATTQAGAVWRDYAGIAWLDPYDVANWDYNIAVALQAAALGFDEIQFDYVRFPSDGNVRDLVYTHHDGRAREDVIAAFLAAAREELHVVGIPISADVFGLVTTYADDMGIGQRLEPLAAAADVISPMVYPSHYGPGNYGLPNPNAAPYETVSRGLQDALQRLGPDGAKQLRPWLQDFSLGHPYGPAEVRAQIKATEDLGIRQWLLWNAGNAYTRGALQPASSVADIAPADPF